MEKIEYSFFGQLIDLNIPDQPGRNRIFRHLDSHAALNLSGVYCKQADAVVYYTIMNLMDTYIRSNPKFEATSNIYEHTRNQLIERAHGGER